MAQHSSQPNHRKGEISKAPEEQHTSSITSSPGRAGRTWLLCQILRDRPILLATITRPRSHSWMPCTNDVTLKKSAICMPYAACHMSAIPDRFAFAPFLT